MRNDGLDDLRRPLSFFTAGDATMQGLVVKRVPTAHHLDAREAVSVFIAEMAVVSGRRAIKLTYNN